MRVADQEFEGDHLSEGAIDRDTQTLAVDQRAEVRGGDQESGVSIEPRAADEGDRVERAEIAARSVG